jgi:para-aminobenzoate synthetase component 1
MLNDASQLPVAEDIPPPPGGRLAALLPALAGEREVVLLETALGWPGLGSWSFLAASVSDAVRAPARGGPDGLVALERALARLRGGAPTAAWRETRREIGVPFAGGLVGWVSYEHGARFERVRSLRPAGLRAEAGLPGLSFAVVTHVVALHQPSGRALLVGPRVGMRAARARWGRWLERSREVGGGRGADLPVAGMPRSSFDRAGYERAVGRAVEYIRRGDVFEVNLSQRVEARTRAAPEEVYARLLDGAAAPFAALLRAAGVSVLSVSPERFLRVEGQRVETRPIKGTRPRGETPSEDARLAAELIASPKDRAELAMIVDLERNDLGRVAAPGSVRVREAAELMSFPAVHHLVGWVEAELAEGRSVFDLLRASFPGGSITGAPKPRAMEIIDELEPTPRGVYTGAIGWIGADHDLDLNVAIRTITLRDGGASFGIGGAVTAESDPAGEYEETLAKGRALARALGFSVDQLAYGD